METAIQALKEGAFGYIQKPIDYDELNALLRVIRRRLSPSSNRLLTPPKLNLDIIKEFLKEGIIEIK